MHGVACHHDDVHGVVERADDAGVAPGQAVLEVVERRVDEHAARGPRGALDADRLVHGAAALELGVREDDGVLRKQRDLRHARVPDDVLDGRRLQLRGGGALLHVEEDDLVLAAQEEHAGAGVEERGASGVRWRAALRDLVLQVADLDLRGAAVPDGEAVARDEDGARGGAGVVRRHLAAARHGAVAGGGQAEELEGAAVLVHVDEQRVLGRVVADAAHHRGFRARRGGLRQALDVVRAARGEVDVLEDAGGDVVGVGAVDGVGGALARELEDDHAGVVPRGEQVDLGVRRQDPEAVVLAAERLHVRVGVCCCHNTQATFNRTSRAEDGRARLQGRAARHVPHADGAVLGVRDDEVLLAAVEDDARYVLHVAPQRVQHPRLRICTRHNSSLRHTTAPSRRSHEHASRGAHRCSARA